MATLVLGRPDFQINLSVHHGTMLVFHAATRGHSSNVQRLLREPGVDVNAEDIFGVIPRALAAGEGHEHEVEALLKHRGTDRIPQVHSTPLFWHWQRKQGILRSCDCCYCCWGVLGCHGVDADSVDDEGCTPLAWVWAMGHERIVQMLLGRGEVTINSLDRDAYTSLAKAARKGHGAVVEALMEREYLD